MAKSTPSPEKGLSYKQMPERETYALGVHALQRACERDPSCVHPQFTLDNGSQVYRPLTFKENIEARVNDYENNKPGKERVQLFSQGIDSCTGMGYKKKTTRFKVISPSPQLITIDKDFTELYLPTRHSQLSGVELDSRAGKYNSLLTPDEVLSHEGWKAALEGDTALLRAYRDIVFIESKQDEAMAFLVLDENIEEDQLRALFVLNLRNSSNAGGSSNLSGFSSFLRGSPPSPLRRVQDSLSQEEQLMKKLRP